MIDETEDGDGWKVEPSGLIATIAAVLEEVEVLADIVRRRMLVCGLRYESER